jgi:hypothetical protein
MSVRPQSQIANSGPNRIGMHVILGKRNCINNKIRPNPVRHENCIVTLKGETAKKYFCKFTYFKLARYSHTCLNAFNEQKKA